MKKQAKRNQEKARSAESGNKESGGMRGARGMRWDEGGAERQALNTGE